MREECLLFGWTVAIPVKTFLASIFLQVAMLNGRKMVFLSPMDWEMKFKIQCFLMDREDLLLHTPTAMPVMMISMLNILMPMEQ